MSLTGLLPGECRHRSSDLGQRVTELRRGLTSDVDRLHQRINDHHEDLLKWLFLLWAGGVLIFGFLLILLLG